MNMVKVPSTGEWKRIVLWSFWTLNMLMNAVYMVMTFATCTKLVASIKPLNISFSNHTWRAPIAATALGGVMVLLFNLLSCFILIRKSINRSGPGFGYGFIMAWCFVMAFFTFLCGLVTSGFHDVVADELEKLPNWGKVNTGAYVGTTAFSFICAAFYMFFFICLVVFQGGIMKQTGLYDAKTDLKRRVEMSAINHGVMPGAPGQQI